MMLVSASGPSKNGVAHKKSPATALCAAREFVPSFGARTVDGLSVRVEMESSKCLQDK